MTETTELEFDFLSFNTGRAYSDEGQKIVLAAIDGGIYFEDITRNLGGFYPTLPLDTHAFLERYDSTSQRDYTPPSMCQWPHLPFEDCKVRLRKWEFFQRFLRQLGELVPGPLTGHYKGSADAGKGALDLEQNRRAPSRA